MRSRDFDARLAERALREHWPVPEDRRPELVARLIAIALDDKTEPREAISACKALLLASKTNLDGIKTAILADSHDTILDRLNELEHPDSTGSTGEPPPIG